MLVHTIKKVPESIFDAAVSQVLEFDYSQLPDNKYVQGFKQYEDQIHFKQKGLKPIFLRSHVSGNIDYDSVKPIEYCQLTESKDDEILYTTFYHMIELLNWVKNLVKGIEFGNVYISHMQPNGGVTLHIDPGEYFRKYSRFHIPLKTNSQALFDGGPNTVQEHMPVGHLCRLNNLLPHQAYNLGSEVRVHLIMDILLKHGNRVL